MSKNPFELRTDVLAMAKDYMDQQQKMAENLAQKAFEAALDFNHKASEQWEKYVPKMYTMEELMQKAQEMYGFISKKD